MKPNGIFIQRTAHGYAYEGLEVTGLTPRESQVILLAAQGKNNIEIAAALSCSVGNIKQLLTALFCKMRADSRTELITKAFTSHALRALVIMLAIYIPTIAPWYADAQDQIARSQRVRPRSRNSTTRIREGNLIWLPETGELIIV